MTPEQQEWLEQQVATIPGLFDVIGECQDRAETLMGERVINGRTVRLMLVAEVDHTGENPLESHSSGRGPMPSD